MAGKEQILSNLGALGFNNTSDAASNEILAQGVGDFTDNIETEMVNTKNAITNVVATQRYGKAGYYNAKAKAFQLGDDLIPTGDDLDPGYAVIDKTKQIVSQSAFEDDDGALSLKVAKTNSLTGLLEQLTVDEKAAFDSYYVNFEVPGLPISKISLPGNVFSFVALCTFNAGYNLANLKINVQAALNSFAQTFDFNGVLYPDQLSDYVKQQVPGVIDFFINNTQLDGAAFVGSIKLTSGYFNYAASVVPGIQYNPVNG